jgi:hypothetical protein
MPYCERCGKKLEEDARYCSLCGYATDEAPPPQSEPDKIPAESGETPSTEQASVIQEQPPSWGRRMVFVALIIIVLLAITFSVTQFLPQLFRPQPTQTINGISWSGYSVSSSLGTPQQEVTKVSGTWVVPTLVSSSGSAYSAAWVGIGGQYDQTLIQIGTEHDILRGKINYSTWYEMLPDYPVYLNMSIAPGDTMTASISLTNSSTNTWSLSIMDVTNGQLFQKDFQYYSSMLTAEWVLERPTLFRGVGNLANFGEVKFTNCNAVIGGKSGSITDFPSSILIMNGHRNNQLVSVSDFSTSSLGFTITFESSS